MRTLAPRRLLLIVTALSILASTQGCAYLGKQPDGQISVKVVSWAKVKKLAEPDAGLPGHKITVMKPVDQFVVDSKVTDSNGMAVFAVPAGSYLVRGASDQPEAVTVESGKIINLKLIEH